MARAIADVARGRCSKKLIPTTSPRTFTITTPALRTFMGTP